MNAVVLVSASLAVLVVTGLAALWSHIASALAVLTP